MPLPLEEIFPDADYRFHLTLRRAELAPFFATRSHRERAERRHWLGRGRDDYVLADVEAGQAIAELETLAAQWELLTPAPGGSLMDRVQRMGEHLEPDFVLLVRDAEGSARIRAGAVCFPSWWSLPEKRGLTLEATHGVVPGLNPAIGTAIHAFLDRLRPGLAYERANWGLAATAELNLHPARGAPRLAVPVEFDRVWVRIEDQILAALPDSGAVLFGIRLRILPLDQIAGQPALKRGFQRALATMSADLAAYKGLGEVRGELLAALARSALRDSDREMD